MSKIYWPFLLPPPFNLIALAYLAWKHVHGSGNVTSKTRRILILGPKGAGKTTLWKMLKGDTVTRGSTFPTVKETHYNSFLLGNKTIIDPIDIGGDKIFQNEDTMKELLKSNTFIFILFDIQNLSNKKGKEYLEMLLCCILKYVNDHREELENIGLNLVATCCDKYNGDIPVKEYVNKNLPQIVKIFLKKTDSSQNIKVGDLFDGILFDEIKKEIIAN